MSQLRSYSVHAKVALATLSSLIALSLPAMAGNVPAPVAGILGPVLGPYGLLAAGVAYGGYRLVKHFRTRR
jgi:hypothetical protein